MFEVLAEDLLGRIGRITARSGRLETPAFLPVINPVTQEIPASWMKENLGAEAVITNAYIISRRLRREAEERGVHEILGFQGVVMTDSGGYQVLEYGDIEATAEEIALLQEEMGSDIAVPLDVPTGLTGRERAEETIEKTLRNLEATIKVLEGRGERRALWTAPIQGGVHLDLLERCARREVEMGFDLYSLGSPTPLMEGYRFDKLFPMLLTARRVIGPGKPLHLFGAGHPMMFAFAVALGADTFDSASYYLYAKDDRYITSTGTLRVERLDYLPCECPICSKTSVEELREMPREQRTRLIAMHNLYTCFREVREIRQAIRDGRLMELLEQRARSHPRLYQAFHELLQSEEAVKFMEEHTPITGRRGMNLFNSLSLRRPRVRRARRRLLENYYRRRVNKTLILIPVTRQISMEKLEKLAAGERFDAAFYGTPYGLIPYELRYVYPFSQTNYPSILLEEAREEILSTSLSQVSEARYQKILLMDARAKWLRGVAEHLAEKLREMGVELEILRECRSRESLSRPSGREKSREAE